MPKRIQRKRTKGWRMPEGAVYVGRPTKWGNPFIVGMRGTPDRSTAVRQFASECGSIIDAARLELRGKDLACFCPLYQPCHADVLLEIANSDDAQFLPAALPP